MPRDLKSYFNGIADILAVKFRNAGDSAENADIGSNREIICKEFLKKHVPKRFSVNIGGDIFGVNGDRSGQVDILVNHDMSMNFMENHKIRCPVESLTSAIAVKSTLTKNELFSALDNLATIPQSNETIINLSLLKKDVSAYVLSWPSLFIFAYDGISQEKCIEHMIDYYSSNKVTFNRIPRSIIVNGKYQIVHLHYNVPQASADTCFDRNNLKAASISEDKKGAPLFWLMCEITKGLTWLDNMYLDYSVYYREAYSSQTKLV